MQSIPRHVARVALLVVFPALACHLRSSASDTTPLTDADIVAIILAANNTDLSYARLAPARARSAEVLRFAERMTTDHTILNARVTEIAASASIVAHDHPLSLDFRDRSAARRDVLRELDGAAFDSTYTANEIQYHTELLAAIDGVLVPSARNATLRDFVKTLRPAVSAHLAHAEQMRATLAAPRK